jgi:hypothetical protein
MAYPLLNLAREYQGAGKESNRARRFLIDVMKVQCSNDIRESVTDDIEE